MRSASGESRVEEGFWVAVLPFKYTGSNEDLKALAEGLSEEIVTGLSRFSYLRVIARGSTLRYANQATDLRSVGKELGARYVMEGFLSGLHESPFHGFSVEFSDYRNYQPGDDPKHVDWRLYARSDRLCIKRYMQETNVRFYIVCDTSASMAYRGQKAFH